MPVWKIETAVQARRDIRDVLAWTGREFGTVQRKRYRVLIDDAVVRLASYGPFIPGSQTVTENRPGIRRLLIAGRASHLLLYRQSGPDRILILRLLHATMDLPRHLEG